MESSAILKRIDELGLSLMDERVFEIEIVTSQQPCKVT